MIKVLCLLADNGIDAEFVHVPGVGYRWVGKAWDTVSGKTERFTWTGDQFAAVMSLGALSVGEDNIPGYDVEALYETVSGLFDEWAEEVRLVP